MTNFLVVLELLSAALAVANNLRGDNATAAMFIAWAILCHINRRDLETK